MWDRVLGTPGPPRGSLKGGAFQSSTQGRTLAPEHLDAKAPVRFWNIWPTATMPTWLSHSSPLRSSFPWMEVPPPTNYSCVVRTVSTPRVSAHKQSERLLLGWHVPWSGGTRVARTGTLLLWTCSWARPLGPVPSLPGRAVSSASALPLHLVGVTELELDWALIASGEVCSYSLSSAGKRF